MSIKELVHSHHHWTIQEIESLLKPAFDTLILVTAIAFMVWLALGVQIEPSSGGSNSMNPIGGSIETRLGTPLHS